MEATKRLSSLVSTKSEHRTAMDSITADEAKLADLGYEQELKRSFSLVGMLGFSFSIVTCWTALGGVLIVGITAGGPPVMVWSWLGVCACTLCVAYSFAEMCSAYPVAGGQYSWVAILAPPKIARGLSYVTGWFMITGIVAMGATNNFIAANFVIGMAQLNNPDYVIQRWHVVLLTYLIAILAGLSNLKLSRFFDKLSTGFLVWNVASFLIVCITILATNKNKQSAAFVFTDFQNDTGFSSPGMAVMIGLLQSFFGMCCYDAPTKMSEDMLNPSVDAPRAIIMSVYLGAVTGFLFLVSAFFCISDIESVATTATGVPLIQIFADSTGNIGGATFLTFLVTVICFGAANGLMAEGSRALYAFARDQGLPASRFFSKVNKKTGVPDASLLLCLIVQMILNSIYFASYEGFSTVIAISTAGFYLSYGMPLLARVWSTFTSGAHKQIAGTAYSLGKWGPTMNIIGLVFLAFAGVDFQFPSIGPVTADNMNYCIAALGVIGLIAAVTWFAGGKNKFTGPQVTVQEGLAVPIGTRMGGSVAAQQEKEAASSSASSGIEKKE